MMSKKYLSENDQIVLNDISRFKTNKSASNLILLSLVFGCLYFLVMYAQCAGDLRATFYENGKNVYTIQMGVSVILNLVVLLAVFYSSIKIKNYSKIYCYVAGVVGIVQIVRIFVYPLQTYRKHLAAALGAGNRLFGIAVFLTLVIMLVLSAACLIGGAVMGYIKAMQRENFIKQIENGEVDLEAAYKDEPEEVEYNDEPEGIAVNDESEEVTENA